MQKLLILFCVSEFLASITSEFPVFSLQSIIPQACNFCGQEYPRINPTPRPGRGSSLGLQEKKGMLCRVKYGGGLALPGHYGSHEGLKGTLNAWPMELW